MSLEITAICDGCGTVSAGGRTAAAARADVRSAGGKSPCPGGQDLCAGCVKAGTEPQGRHAETGPLSARHERLAG